MTERTLDPLIAKIYADYRRRAGLKLCARAYLLSEARTRTPSERAGALATAEQLFTEHGPANDGWLSREIERQRPAFEAGEADRSARFAHLGPNGEGPGGWSIYDLADIATCVLAHSAHPLAHVELIERPAGGDR